MSLTDEPYLRPEHLFDVKKPTVRAGGQRTWPYQAPKAPPSYSFANPISWEEDTPLMTEEQFTKVWATIIEALRYKDIQKGELILRHWNLTLAVALRQHGTVKQTFKPICPLVPTGKRHTWLAEESSCRNVFSVDEIARLNRNISTILGVKPPLF